MKRISIVTISLMLLIWLLPTTAKTYRWVDEKGVTIYSQSPPPSGKATIINPPPKPAAAPNEIMKDLKRQQTAIDDASKKKQETAQEREQKAKNEETKKQNCAVARKNLEMVQQHPRARIKKEDGSYKTLSPEERKVEIEKNTKYVEEFCN